MAERFPRRQAQKRIDGRTVSGWFSEDFILAELRTLRARQRLRFRDVSHDGRYPVPTLREVLELVRRKERETGRTIGIYPETKHPSYFRGIGLPLEEPLLALLTEFGYTGREAPVFIQSFEVGNLQWLAERTELRLVQLLSAPGRQPADLAAAGDPRTYGDLASPAGLRRIATYADGIGPWKELILPDGSGPPTALVAAAHEAGLVVHAYTFRNEPRYLARGYGDDPIREYQRYFSLGVDGVFTDFPATALEARRQWQAAQ